MNPTDEVDDLLTRAGARWRADQPSPAEPDLDRILGGRRRPRRWVPALAAASVAAIAAAALVVLPDGTPKPAAGPSTTGQSPQSFAQGNQQPYDDLLVRPGDKVQVSGSVIVPAGKAPVYCPDLPKIDIGYLPGQEPAPSCPADLSVTLKGLDLDRLVDRSTHKGVITGSAKVIGIWGADQSIDVQEQGAPQRRTTPLLGPLPPLPCPAPAGGWVSKPSNVYATAVTAFLDAHADQIDGPNLYYPKGYSRGAPVVVLVGVAHGDLSAIQREFEKVYRGNLCVAPVRLSRADNARINAALGPVMGKNGLGIYGGGGSGAAGSRVGVQLLVYTEQVMAALAPVGLDALNIEPAILPVR